MPPLADTHASWTDLRCACRRLGQRTGTPYTGPSTCISNFPYFKQCDNDLGHSPLRLSRGYLEPYDVQSRANMYCWNVTQFSNTQCATNPDGYCCRQDLLGIQFEIRECGVATAGPPLTLLTCDDGKAELCASIHKRKHCRIGTMHT